jgi:hypothetical protein
LFVRGDAGSKMHKNQKCPYLREDNQDLLLLCVFDISVTIILGLLLHCTRLLVISSKDPTWCNESILNDRWENGQKFAAITSPEFESNLSVVAYS